MTTRRFFVAVLAMAAVASDAGRAQDETERVRATELIGIEVRAAGGETLGEIADLVIDARNGRVEQAVLEFGGWLGFGARRAAVPYAALADLSPEDLARMPPFAPPAWPQVLATRLVGAPVRDRAGREAGEIQDFVISADAGRVYYAIVDPDDGWRNRSFAVPVSMLNLRHLQIRVP